MAEPGWPRHAVRVGRFEFRRSLRAVWETKVRLAFMALVLVFPSALVALLGVIFADEIRDVGTVALPPELRGTVAMFWLFAVFVVGQRVASARPRIESDAFVLTTVSARTAACGLALAETLRLVVVGNAVFTAGLGDGTLWVLLGPLSAVVLPWLAGSLFAINPLGDEGSVLPMTLVAVSGRRYVRGLMLPGLALVGPVAVLGTAGFAAAGPYAPVQVAGLVPVASVLTGVSAALGPAIGMAFPRFSGFSIGQSKSVRPPRLLAVTAHVLATAGPGALLVLLVVAPRLARSVVAGLVGYLPAVLARLAGLGGPGSVERAFVRVGDAVLATDLGLFRTSTAALLLGGGLASAALAYRWAVRRFERFEPQ